MNNYEAEVVEDIPEQFDLSRYKKNRAPPPATAYRNAPNATGNYGNGAQLMHHHHPHHPGPHHHQAPAHNYIFPMLNNNYDGIHNAAAASQPFIPQYPAQTYHLPRQNQHFMGKEGGYAPLQPQMYYPKTDFDPYGHDLLNKKKNYAPPPRYLSDSSVVPNEYEDQNYTRQPPPPPPPPVITSSQTAKETKPEGRKKNSFEDEENENPYQKKEYFLKGGDDSADTAKWMSNSNRESSREPRSGIDSELSRSSSKLDTYVGTKETVTTPATNTMPKSSLKQTNKKSGVTFDEKLEVHEVKNPHYGLEIKSEKREIRKKRKDKQKEEEVIVKTKLEMKAKLQNKNMLHYYVRVVLSFCARDSHLYSEGACGYLKKSKNQI